MLRMFNVRAVNRSLGTPIRAEAEAIAAQEIALHRVRLHYVRSKREGAISLVTAPFRFEPGRRHELPDGSSVVATNDTLIYLDQSGTVLRVSIGSRGHHFRVS